MEHAVSITSRLKSFAMRFTRGGNTGFWWGSRRRESLIEIRNGEESSVVSAPVQWMMKSFLEAPLVVERKLAKTWEQEDDHAMVTLIENPNPAYSGDLLFRALVGSLAYTGNGYWVKIRDNTLAPVQLWWIPTILLEPRWPTDGSEFISHYEYRPGGGLRFRLPVEDIIHFRWDIDPENDRKGLSPLAAVLREVMADEEASRFAASLLKNMGVPGMIISPDGDFAIGDDEMKAAKEKLTEEFSGERVGTPFVAGAPTKVQQYGFSPQQMDMKMLRRVPEERVTAALGVPAIVAGLGAGLDRSTFANFKEAREAAYEGATIPLQQLVKAVLKHQLLPEFENDLVKTRVNFDLKEVRVLMEDQSKLVERKLKELSAGVITLAEYRQETGRETDDTMNVYIRNFSLMEVRAEDLGKKPEPQPATTLPPGGGPPPPGNPSDPGADPTAGTVANGNGTNANGKNRKQKAQAAKEATTAQRAFVVTLANDLEALYPVLTVKLGSLFDELGRQAAEIYVGMTPIPSDPKSKKSIEDDYVARIIEQLAIEKSQVQYGTLLENHFGLVLTHTVKSLNDAFELHVSMPDYTARHIMSQGGTRAGLLDMTEQAKTSLYRALVDGRTLGEGPDKLARRIRSEVTAGRYTSAGSTYRAKLIARTETRFAQNVSAVAVYKEAGARGLLAFDGHGDPACEARDGKEFSYGEAEHAISSTHPNCTLAFAPVF